MNPHLFHQYICELGQYMYSFTPISAMSTKRRKCVNDPDIFCYICGRYTLADQRRSVTDFVKRAYLGFFEVKLGDQDKDWAPHIVCRTCVTDLTQWSQGGRHHPQFAIPMVWREPTNHHDDCYFCSVNVKGHSKKTIKNISYPSLHSAIRPVPHSEELPVKVFTELPSLDEDVEVEDIDTADTDRADSDTDFEAPFSSEKMESFNQSELSDLCRDLHLSKEGSELLGSRLKEKNLLDSETKITFYRTREKDFRQYFKTECEVVYCHSVQALLLALGVVNYVANEWRLFIDASKRSLKAVLLHNTNKYASVPLAHTTHLKETYENIKTVLRLIKYHSHNWIICVDLKMVCFLLGQQPGFTKYPCFLCWWDSRDRARHWTQKDWPERESLDTSDQNIIHPQLVDRDRIVFPPLHLKLGYMKQFVKALNKDGSCFQYICKKFKGISIEKLKNGVFEGPDIRTLIKDANFVSSMNETEKAAWESFVLVVQNFLGNKRADNYKELIKNMLDSYQALGCLMNIKLHYINSHLDMFPENLGDVSDEQGERFHQDIKVMEERYQGRWDINMMADHCWNIKRDCPEAQHSRKSKTRAFLPQYK